MTLVRADRGKHRLSSGPIRGRGLAVGRLTNEQLEDAQKGLEAELVRLAGLDVDALTQDLKAIAEELALRAVGL